MRGSVVSLMKMIPSITMSESTSSSSSDDEKNKQQEQVVRHTHTHLTYSRHHLVDVAHETIQISENGYYVNQHGKSVIVKQDLDTSVESSVHYEHEFDFVKALAVHDAAAAAAASECCDGANNDAPQQYRPNKRHFTLKTSSSRNVLAPSTPERRQQSLSSSSSSSNKVGEQFTLGSPRPSGSSSPKINTPRIPQFPKTSFLVVSANWLESALELIDANRRISSSPLNSSSSSSSNMRGDDGHHYYRVGVLNSGSGTTPGGKFLQGTVSQEDCLCRASLLYSCISQPKFQSDNRFYGMNRTLRYGTSNCVIFSPDVPVIRDDSTVSSNLLDTYEKVSFVTIPAPNAFTTSSRSGKEYNCDENTTTSGSGMISRNTSIIDLSSMGNENLEHLLFEEKRKALLYSLTDRISRALSAFVLGGCTDLILPAFGCGVHGNDPAMVASVFRELLTDPSVFGGRFRTIVFAIPPCRKQNYQAFASYFQNNRRVMRVSSKPNLLRAVTMN